MPRFTHSSDLHDFPNSDAGQHCQQMSRQVLTLLCTQQLLPQADKTPATGQSAIHFKNGWQRLQERCFSSAAWHELADGFEQKRQGKPDLKPEHYLLGQAVNELAAWLLTTTLQPDQSAVLAAAAASEHDSHTLQHCLRAVLWQPDPDRGESLKLIQQSVTFYKWLDVSICHWGTRLFEGLTPRQFMERNEYSTVFVQTLEKLNNAADWDSVVAKYRMELAGGCEYDLLQYYRKHASLTAKEQFRPLSRQQTAENQHLGDFSGQILDSPQGGPAPKHHHADSHEFFTLLHALKLNATQQAVFLLRPWPMPAFAGCRETALPLILAGAADPADPALSTRLQQAISAHADRSTEDAAKRENAAKRRKDPLRKQEEAFWKLRLERESKLHLFRTLFQRSSSATADQQLLLQRCLDAAATVAGLKSLEQVKKTYSAGADAYSSDTPGTRRPKTPEAQTRHDFKNFAIHCYLETAARKEWLNCRISLQACRENDTFNDTEIAHVLNRPVGTVEAAATQIRNAMKTPADHENSALLTASGIRDSATELRLQLELKSLQQAACDGLTLTDLKNSSTNFTGNHTRES
ncbi:MAG: hypothetical protein ACKO3T_10310 [Planctomycetaceae bacterium]